MKISALCRLRAGHALGLILLGMVLAFSAVYLRSRYTLRLSSDYHRRVFDPEEYRAATYLRWPGESDHGLLMIHGESWLVRTERVLKALPGVHIIATRLHSDPWHPSNRTHAIVVRDGEPISAVLTWTEAAELLRSHGVRFLGDDGPKLAAEILADIFRVDLLETDIVRTDRDIEMRARFFIPPFIYETVLFLVDESGVLSYEEIISSHQHGAFM